MSAYDELSVEDRKLVDEEVMEIERSSDVHMSQLDLEMLVEKLSTEGMDKLRKKASSLQG